MDLHHTPSHAPVRDAELPPTGADPAALSPAITTEPPSSRKARFAHPDPEVRMAERDREDQELKALEGRITELWGHINAATAHFLTLVAEFDRRQGWAQHGMASCAQWLSWQCGIGRVAATEKVRTARALESLPKISAAFGEGRLSYSKVRALTRVATVETEESLLHIALNGTAAHVERTVRGYRRVTRDLERDEAEALHERRHLLCWREADGSVTLQARLTPEVGELLFKALDAAQAQLEERGGDARNAGKRRAVRPRIRPMERMRRMRFPQVFPRKHLHGHGRGPRCRHAGTRSLKVFPRKHLPAAPVSGVWMLSSTSSSDFWPGAVHVPPPVLTKSSCTLPTMPCATCRRAAGRSSRTDVLLPWRRRGGWVVTARWSGWWKAQRASRWPSDAGPAPCRRPFGARCAFATAAAAFRAVTVPAMYRPTTSSIGLMGERLPWTIW